MSRNAALMGLGTKRTRMNMDGSFRSSFVDVTAAGVNSGAGAGAGAGSSMMGSLMPQGGFPSGTQPQGVFGVSGPLSSGTFGSSNAMAMSAGVPQVIPTSRHRGPANTTLDMKTVTAMMAFKLYGTVNLRTGTGAGVNAANVFKVLKNFPLLELTAASPLKARKGMDKVFLDAQFTTPLDASLALMQDFLFKNEENTTNKFVHAGAIVGGAMGVKALVGHNVPAANAIYPNLFAEYVEMAVLHKKDHAAALVAYNAVGGHATLKPAQWMYIVANVVKSVNAAGVTALWPAFPIDPPAAAEYPALEAAHAACVRLAVADRNAIKAECNANVSPQKSIADHNGTLSFGKEVHFAVRMVCRAKAVHADNNTFNTETRMAMAGRGMLGEALAHRTGFTTHVQQLGGAVAVGNVGAAAKEAAFVPLPTTSPFRSGPLNVVKMLLAEIVALEGAGAMSVDILRQMDANKFNIFRGSDVMATARDVDDAFFQFYLGSSLTLAKMGSACAMANDPTRLHRLQTEPLTAEEKKEDGAFGPANGTQSHLLNGGSVFTDVANTRALSTGRSVEVTVAGIVGNTSVGGIDSMMVGRGFDGHNAGLLVDGNVPSARAGLLISKAARTNNIYGRPASGEKVGFAAVPVSLNALVNCQNPALRKEASFLLDVLNIVAHTPVFGATRFSELMYTVSIPVWSHSQYVASNAAIATKNQFATPQIPTFGIADVTWPAVDDCTVIATAKTFVERAKLFLGPGVTAARLKEAADATNFKPGGVMAKQKADKFLESLDPIVNNKATKHDKAAALRKTQDDRYIAAVLACCHAIGDLSTAPAMTLLATKVSAAFQDADADAQENDAVDVPKLNATGARAGAGNINMFPAAVLNALNTFVSDIVELMVPSFRVDIATTANAAKSSEEAFAAMKTMPVFNTLVDELRKVWGHGLVGRSVANGIVESVVGSIDTLFSSVLDSITDISMPNGHIQADVAAITLGTNQLVINGHAGVSFTDVFANAFAPADPLYTLLRPAAGPRAERLVRLRHNNRPTNDGRGVVTDVQTDGRFVPVVQLFVRTLVRECATTALQLPVVTPALQDAKFTVPAGLSSDTLYCDRMVARLCGMVSNELLGRIRVPIVVPCVFGTGRSPKESMRDILSGNSPRQELRKPLRDMVAYLRQHAELDLKEVGVVQTRLPHTSAGPISLGDMLQSPFMQLSIHSPTALNVPLSLDEKNQLTVYLRTARSDDETMRVF